MLPFEYTDDGVVVTTLYVRSFGKKTKRVHLVEYFSTFGTVKNVRMYHKSATRPFGFVIFASAESAAKALSQRGHKIGNREIVVNKADSWHQETPLEIELTNVTGTHMLDVIDDCLYEIFSLKRISLMDLCMVAETCTRFKDIAVRIFKTSYKICYLHTLKLETYQEMRRFFINFGSSITEVVILSFCFYSREQLELVIRYCDTLESLTLSKYNIDKDLADKLRPMFSRLKKLTIEDCHLLCNHESLFSNCAELVELKMLSSNSEFHIIFENHFQKLQEFEYSHYGSEPLKDYVELFFSRHKNLKALYMHNCEPFLSLLPVIVENCKDLEKIKIKGSEKTLKSLLKLTDLKELTIDCCWKNVTAFVQELPQLRSLEFLELSRVKCDSQLVPALAKLKNLNVLRLSFCDCDEYNRHPTNINNLAELEKLNELWFQTYENVQIDVVAFVKRMVNLKKLRLWNLFKMDKKAYVELVNVVRERTNRVPSSPFEIWIRNFDNEVADLQRDGNNKEFVKLYLFYSQFLQRADNYFYFYSRLQHSV